jgi:1-acyl-sn-glycerol-3-phosphate acyltransferase
MGNPSALRLPARVALDLLTVRHIEGRQRLPARGPCLVVTNHLSFLDAVVIFDLIGGDQTSAWAAEKWERNLIFGTLLRLGNAIFIRRGQVDRRALEHAADWLRAGRIFMMAPEGTRSPTASLGPGKLGAAYLAHWTGAPVLPIAHWGTETTMRSWLHLRRPRIGIRVGEPFTLPEIHEADRAEGLRRNTDEIMCRLAALLPPAYRGIYSDHPRTLELAAGTTGEASSSS